MANEVRTPSDYESITVSVNLSFFDEFNKRFHFNINIALILEKQKRREQLDISNQEVLIPQHLIFVRMLRSKGINVPVALTLQF